MAPPLTILEVIWRVEFIVILVFGGWCGLVGARVHKVKGIHDTIDYVILGAFWASCVGLVRRFYTGPSDNDYIWVFVLIAGSVFANRAIGIVGSRFLNRLNDNNKKPE